MTTPNLDEASLGEALDELDRGYAPFPSFSTFRQSVGVTTQQWDEYASKLRDAGASQPQLIERARQVAVRAAAVDTGAIENLYQTDRGFTFSVATGAAAWEAAANAKGTKVRDLISSQLEAYEYIIDSATKKTSISESWLRTLHEVICASQDTFSVETAIGSQEQSLPKGKYKELSNHVKQPDGTFHSYAPVLATAPEMARFVQELKSPEFDTAHPILQAAYAHYCLVAVHPFADGNGRVARALGSVFTYRSSSIPLLIMIDHRQRYFDALNAADAGQYQDLVDFVEARGIDALLLVNESLRTAAAPDTATAAAQLARLYIARRGLTHAELDQLGMKILQDFVKLLQDLLAPHRGAYLDVVCNIEVYNPGAWPPGFRPPISSPAAARIFLQSPAPALVTFVRHYNIVLPKAGLPRDELILWSPQSGDQIPIPIADVSPSLTSSVQFRLSMAAERVTAETLNAVRTQAEEVIRQSGY